MLNDYTRNNLKNKTFGQGKKKSRRKWKDTKKIIALFTV